MHKVWDLAKTVPTKKAQGAQTAALIYSITTPEVCNKNFLFTKPCCHVQFRPLDKKEKAVTQGGGVPCSQHASYARASINEHVPVHGSLTAVVPDELHAQK